MWRSSDGKTRIDMPQSSVISDPISKHTIVLDHLKKEASIIPMTPPGSPIAPPPGTAPGAAALHPSSVHVQDLGKSMIEGHEVEGKRYTLPHVPPPPKPQIPGMKIPGAPAVPGAKVPGAPSVPGAKMPGAPAIPGAKLPTAPSAPKPPGAPALPQKPKLPATPSVAEVWTSVKLKTPVLTKVTTAAGEHTTYCKPTLTAEHPPTVFQIPPGYKIKPPTPPTVPKPPAMPKLPKT
jgi:hypothetical protein